MRGWARKVAGVIGVAFLFLLNNRDRRDEGPEKDLGCTRNSKGFLLEWKQPRFQLTVAESGSVKPVCKENCVFLA